MGNKKRKTRSGEQEIENKKWELRMEKKSSMQIERAREKERGEKQDEEALTLDDKKWSGLERDETVADGAAERGKQKRLLRSAVPRVCVNGGAAAVTCVRCQAWSIVSE